MHWIHASWSQNTYKTWCVCRTMTAERPQYPHETQGIDFVALTETNRTLSFSTPLSLVLQQPETVPSMGLQERNLQCLSEWAFDGDANRKSPSSWKLEWTDTGETSLTASPQYPEPAEGVGHVLLHASVYLVHGTFLFLQMTFHLMFMTSVCEQWRQRWVKVFVLIPRWKRKREQSRTLSNASAASWQA